MSQTAGPHQDLSPAGRQAGREVYQRITANIARIMQGQAASTRKLLVAFASGGHVLLEDFPGTGKTTLAKALARSVAANFKRIQFTPDLLPGDLTGTDVYRPEDGSFRFQPGPVSTRWATSTPPGTASASTSSSRARTTGPWPSANGGCCRCVVPAA